MKQKEFTNKDSAAAYMRLITEDIDFIDVSIYPKISGFLTEKDFNTIKEKLGADAYKLVMDLYIANK